jgi:uncharacterized membrane protein
VAIGASTLATRPGSGLRIRFSGRDSSHGSDFAALRPLLPVFLSYVLSLIYVGIYWNKHHHLLKAGRKTNAGIMWANLHLLFWLSLFPFVTGWMGDNYFTAVPSAFYGGVLLMAAVAYFILQSLSSKRTAARPRWPRRWEPM